MSSPATASAFGEITRLAGDPRMHQAFRWLHLQEQTVFAWQQELVQVPAPPFGERARAEWLAGKFNEIGLEDVSFDAIGNVIGGIRCGRPGARCVLVSAHLDTVFPADTPIQPVIDGQRIHAPGACDNGSGIAGMLAIASAMVDAGLHPGCDVIFIGNVGEEGDGDLRGMRYIYQRAPFREMIEAHIVLDGAGENVAVTQALGSLRYRVTLTGPGGHSWTDAGMPNPIVLMSRVIARMADVSLPAVPRTTFNVGTIDGGTSVNAIPERTVASFDLRSTDPAQLIRLEVELYRAVEDIAREADCESAASRAEDGTLPAKQRDIQFEIEKVGDRPTGRLPESCRLMDLLYAVDRQLGLRTEIRVASTDANIPLFLGVPALTLGAGGNGGSIHTRAEWYDASGREIGLKRVLLLLLGVAG
jgi:acetylornithine deacetylase/succinyl-diaminopimelate desuccinylase-like protein